MATVTSAHVRAHLRELDEAALAVALQTYSPPAADGAWSDEGKADIQWVLSQRGALHLGRVT